VDPEQLVRVLVTGATGFIASHLIPQLAEDEHEVLALGHDPARIPSLESVVPLEVDLLQTHDLRHLPAAHVVVHLAQANTSAPGSASQLFAVNTASTAHLLEYALHVGAQHFVYASSATVYGFGSRPFLETDTTRPHDFYSATKIASEALIAAYRERFRTTIMRLVAPYGPGQVNRLIPRLIARVREGHPITLNDGGRPKLNPIFIADVVRAIERDLEAAGHRVVNVAGDEPVTIRDLGLLIGAVLGEEPVFEPGAARVVGDLVANNDLLHELLDEPLIPLSDGLARTVEITAANG
jgi:UDP-glucose 4-epimerase